MSRYETVIAAIDAANGEDPNLLSCGSTQRPAELVYGERMSERLAKLHPEASEELRIAARAQHLCRWKVPRDTYPMDRAGYHRWRSDLKAKHAQWAGEIMAACGFPPDAIARTASLIRKENLKHDPEAQALEDTACLVFLEHYSGAFAAKHGDGKMIEILKKTWTKMSPRAHQEAGALPLPARITELIARAAGERG